MKQSGVFNMSVHQRTLKFGGFIVFIVLMLALPWSFAAADTKADPKKDAHKQSLTFEDELIEGSTQKPELFYLFQKKNFNYKRLIKLRENFIPEMKRNAEDIQKGRSTN